MAKEFIARNGLIALDNSQISGSLNVSGSLSVNNTPAMLGSIASTQIAFGTGTGVIGGDSGFVWDNTNKELSVGSNVSTKITISASKSSLIADSPQIISTTSSGASFPFTQIGHLIISPRTSAVRNILFYTNNSVNTDFRWSILSSGILQSNGAQTIQTSTGALTLQSGDRNVLINTDTDAGFRLDVNGTARIVGATRIDNLAGTGTRMVVADANGVMGTQALGIGGTIASGQVAFGTGTGVIGGDSGLTWNNTTKILSVTNDAVFNNVNIGKGGGSISSNTRVGTNALLNNTSGNNNTANGSSALLNNTSGATNTANGVSSLRDNTTGSNNTANGASALLNNTTGLGNTANGVSSLRDNTTGSDNVAQGFNAGRFIADGTTPNTITNNSVFIGVRTRAQSDNQTNQIVIGHTAIGLGSNSVVLGNDSITFTGLKGNVGVNTTTNSGFRLDVNGTARIVGATRIDNLAGAGTRMVVADANGVMGTSALPTIINGTGFVKANGTAISYDNTSYLPLTGGTLASSGSTNTLNINHASGSGLALNITKGGNGEGLKVVKTSGSGLAASITGGVTLLDELNLTTKLADAHIASAATWNAKIGGTIASGQVAFGTGTGVVGGNNSFTFESIDFGRLNLQNLAASRFQITMRTSSSSNESVGRIGDYLGNSYIEFYNANLGNFRLVNKQGSENFGSIIFETGSTPTDRWRITNLGILQSNGAQTIQSSTGNLTIATAGGNGNILLSPNGTGNVGIGTTTPSDRLDIVGNIKLLSGGELRLDGGSWNNYLRIWRRSATDDVQLRWQDNTNLMLLRPNGEVIIQSGNVGIGTTAPSERLHVDGNGYFGATNDSTSGRKKLTVETRGFAGLELLGDTANISGEPGGAYILLAQDGAKLTGGATESKAMLGIVQSDNNDGAGGTYTGTTRNSVYFGHKSDTGNLHLGAGNAVRLTINSSGRVLIGSPPPTESTFQLDVNGTFRTTQLNLSALNTAPASATATGVLGEIRITATHIYVCTATNTWVRAALTTW